MVAIHCQATGTCLPAEAVTGYQLILGIEELRSRTAPNESRLMARRRESAGGFSIWVTEARLRRAWLPQRRCRDLRR